MPTRTVFYDNNIEMDCYLNDKGRVFISLKEDDEDDNRRFITLNKSDVSVLIHLLQDIEKQMDDEDENDG